MQLIDGQPLDRAIEELRGEPSLGREATGVIATKAWTWGAEVESVETQERGSESSNGLPVQSHPGDSDSGFDSLASQYSNSESGYFRTIARLAIEAAEALHCAHEFGVVHRDVKPSNLLLDIGGKL